MDELLTTSAVIDELGGIASVAALTGRTYNAASNWRSFDNFPPDTFVVLRAELEKRGKTAPISLWRMVEGAA